MFIRLHSSLLILSVFATSAMGQVEKADHDPQVDSVTIMLKSYAEAFNKQDLDAVSALWAEDCTYLDRTTGERVESRKSMRSDLETTFSNQKHLRLSATVRRLKMVTENVAHVEGQTVVSGANEDPQVSEFSAIIVQKGKQWQIHSLEESAVAAPESSTEALNALAWLVGNWVDEGESSRVETSVRWSANQAFLIRSYTMQTAEGVASEGTQVIGWDPRARHIRSWTFNSDGSFGEGIWSKNGEDWLIKSAQTLANGGAASGTYVLTSSDENEIRMQLIGHAINGEPQPAKDAVAMKRVVKDAESGEDRPDAPAEKSPSAGKSSASR